MNAAKPPSITRQNAQYYDKPLIVSTVDLFTPSLETQNLEPIASTSSHSHQPPIVSTVDLCTQSLETQNFEPVVSTSSHSHQHSLFKQDISPSSHSHQNFKVDEESQTDVGIDVGIQTPTPESYNLGQGYLKHYAGRPEFDLNKIFSSERWRHQEDQEEEERDTEKEHPRSAAAAAASTSSSSPSPRCPIDYVTSPIRHPRSAAAAPPSTSSSDDEDPTLLQSAQDLLGSP